MMLPNESHKEGTQSKIIEIPEYSLDVVHRIYSQSYTAQYPHLIGYSLTIIPLDITHHARKKQYRKVCLGGTFDRIHGGHKLLITHAVSIGEEIVIGMVNDEQMLGKKKLSNMIESYEQRLEGLNNFLRQLAINSFSVFPLHDKFGPAVIDPDIEAIVITPESMDTAQEINYQRRQRGLGTIDIIEICYVWIYVDDEKILLSSTLLRQLEFDQKHSVSQIK